MTSYVNLFHENVMNTELRQSVFIDADVKTGVFIDSKE